MLMSVLAVSLVIGWGGALLVAVLGKSKPVLIDHPNERSSHSIPTPRGGGVGIWLIAVCGAIFILKEPALSILFLLIGGLGLAEDIFGLSYKIRLAVQLVCSAVAATLYLPAVPMVIYVPLLCFFVLFIAWTSNVYNFMDGINGMAGFSGALAFLFLAYFSHFVKHDEMLTVMCITTSVACLGFLPLNLPKAKVFMGDVGSLFLGFFFGVAVLRLASNVSEFICLCAFLSTFYADEIVTMCIRLARRENIFEAHRCHLYQLLVNEFRFPHWKITLGYSIIQFLIGISVLFMRKYGCVTIGCVLMVYFGMFIVFDLNVRRKVKLREQEV